MRFRSLLQNLTLAAVSLLVLVIVVEVLLRTTHAFGAHLSYSIPDSVYAYRFVPHAEFYYHKENPKPITGRINNFGWRDTDWTLQKTAGAIRVAVIGDSHVEAFQVELESTFVKIVERDLNAKLFPRTVEVMNFGRSGFTQTDQLLLMQTDVLKFSPDIIVLPFLSWNDVADVRRETTYDRERPFLIPDGGKFHLDASFRNVLSFQIKTFVQTLKRRSVFVSFLAERYSLYQVERDIRNRMAENAQRSSKLSGDLSLCSTTKDPELEKSYALCKRLFGEMVKVCGEASARPLLVCLPNEAYVTQREQEILRVDPSFNPFFFEDDLAALSLTLQIDYLGLQRVFREEYARNYRPLHWVHMNYEGHRVAGHALSEKIHSMIQRNQPSRP